MKENEALHYQTFNEAKPKYVYVEDFNNLKDQVAIKANQDFANKLESRINTYRNEMVNMQNTIKYLKLYITILIGIAILYFGYLLFR